MKYIFFYKARSVKPAKFEVDLGCDINEKIKNLQTMKKIIGFMYN